MNNEKITMVFGGDVLLSRSFSKFNEKEYLNLRKLFKQAEIGFVNLETTVVDVDYEITQHNISRGTYMITEPHLLKDLKWFGINLVSCANNHSTDWGEQGLLATLKNLKAAQIPFAGIGENLRKAAIPCYLETSKGRVALISATSTFNEWDIATNQSPLVQGKPGVNPLGFKTSYIVDNQGFEALKRLGSSLGFEKEKNRWEALGIFSPEEMGISTETEYVFLDKHFIRGDHFDIRTTAREQHVENNLAQIREARRQADWVIFSLHNHEFGGDPKFTKEILSEMTESAEFMIKFAHQAIDEGADIFIGHGPHIPLGIELYKGKPIFYSLGNLVMEYDTVQYLPSHAYERFNLSPQATPTDFFEARSYNNQKDFPSDNLYWEQVVAVCIFDTMGLEEIILHPLDLGFKKPRSQRGRPVIADEILGGRILKRIAQISQTFDTSIKIEGNVAKILPEK